MDIGERRQDTRIGLHVPVRCQGFTRSGTWDEMSGTEDASFRGASFHLKHPVQVGQVLLLLLPLPKRFRSHDLQETSYRVYGLVRNIKPEAVGAKIGVLFLGPRPPKGFAENPDGLYLLPSDKAPAVAAAPGGTGAGGGAERRAFERLQVYVDLRLTRPEARDTRREERTLAENLSKGGARCPTTLPVDRGEIVHVEEVGGTFRTRAEVCDVRVGPDKVPRLHLRFLDGEAPARLLG